jgi:hypothetical protein
MAQPIVFRGDTITGTLQLRIKNPINPDLEDLYPLPASYIIEVNLPGETATVVLSTANVGEITVISPTLSTVLFTCIPAKSVLLAVTASAAIDCIVTDTTVTPNIVTTFQKLKVIQIQDRANP